MLKNWSRARRTAMRLFALTLGTALGSAALAVEPAGPEPSVPLDVRPGEPVEMAHPALWVIADRDTTIYLFGTFHALDGRMPWFENRVRQAFDSADELVLET